MHIDSSHSTPPAPEAAADAAPGPMPNALAAVLREARRMHRDAQSGSLSRSLPVLRRILLTHSLVGLTLPELHGRRAMVRRKHVLRMLAVEAGFDSWEAWRPVLEGLHAGEVPHFDLLRGAAGYPNHWFSTMAQAQAHAAQHGGRVLAVGTQAVVLAGHVPQ